MNTAVESEGPSRQFMNFLIIAGLTYSMRASILKAVHSEPFSSRSVKAKIFILQVDNKITDAAEASEERKIRYKMSLLRRSAAE